MRTVIPFGQHGRYLVALICLKGQRNRAYHYAKTIGHEESWALRDYLTDQILRSGASELTASELEAMVTKAEPPEHRPIGRVALWKRSCEAASNRLLGSANVELTEKNEETLGRWQRMSSSGT